MGSQIGGRKSRGQLNFRITSTGAYKETRCDDSPYSTDRFDDEEEKQDAAVLPPPEYEAPDEANGDPRFS